MRKMTLAGVAMGALCLLATSANAQTTPPADAAVSPPAAQPAPPVAPAFVAKNTPIVIEISDVVSAETAKRDDWFNLKLFEPVKLNGVIVIPAGTPGKGQVIDAAKPGMSGKPGKLVLAARYLVLNGKQIPIHALKMGLKAEDRSGGAVAASVFVGVFALAVKGGEMEVQPGSLGEAKLGVDFVPDAGGAATPEPASQVAPAPEAAATSSSASSSSASSASATSTSN